MTEILNAMNRVFEIDVSGDVAFEDLDAKLRRAFGAQNLATWIVQAYFSAILLEERWKEATIWAHAQTGELYPTPADAPAAAPLVPTDVPRFRTADEWLATLEDIPGYARSTCYKRHASILEEMRKLNRPFKAAFKSVMLGQSHSELMLRLTTGMDGELDAAKVVKLLPEPLQEATLETLALSDDLETERALQQIVSQKLDEDAAKLAEGTDVRRLNQDLKGRLSVGATYRIAPSEKVPGAFVVLRDLDDEETAWIVGVRSESDPLAKVPRDLYEWLAGRLRVRL